MKNKITAYLFAVSFGFVSSIFCSEVSKAQESTKTSQSKIYPTPALPFFKQPNIFWSRPCQPSKNVTDRWEIARFVDCELDGPILLPAAVRELVLVNVTIDGGDVIFHALPHEQNVVKICLASRICGRVQNGTIIVVPELTKR